MNTIFFRDVSAFDRAAMSAHVVSYAQRYYRGEAAEEELAQWAEEAVVRVWRDGVVVTKFVPLLALREVRERIAADQAKLRAA